MQFSSLLVAAVLGMGLSTAAPAPTPVEKRDVATPAQQDTINTVTSVANAQPVSYSPGWCTFHLHESAQMEGNNVKEYTFDVLVYDNAHNVVLDTTGFTQPPGGAMDLAPKLPYNLEFKVPVSVNDPITWQYYGGHYSSASSCGVGGWTEGYTSRDMDCGFPCTGN